MLKHPLLIKRKNFLEDFIETIVMIPRDNGFPREIYQLDIDCFFAELGYAEAVSMPLRAQEDGLYVYIHPNSESMKCYEEAGFACPSPLPFKIEDGALVVLGCLSAESEKAGYAGAESIERDDIPF